MINVLINVGYGGARPEVPLPLDCKRRVSCTMIRTLSRPQKQYGHAPPPQTKFLDRFRWVDIPLVAVTGAG